jgi:hypothetical protein
MGSPDHGVAEPGSAGEPATPGLPADGSDPGMYPESEGIGGGEEAGAEETWGESPPEGENGEGPWAPDEPDQPPNDEGWWGGGNSGGGSSGGGGGSSGGGDSGGGGGGGGWSDWLDL